MENKLKQQKPVIKRQRSLLVQLKDRLILSIGLLVLWLLLSSAIGVYVSFTQQQLGDQKVVMHDNINGLIQAMIDQETGLRGYVSTNNTTFLDPFTNGQTQYASFLQKLKDTTANPDFSSAASALAQVEDRASAWTTSFANVQIANMRDGKLDIARSDSTNEQGKTLFDAFRGAASHLQQVSSNDLAAIQNRNNQLDLGAIGLVILFTLSTTIWVWHTFSRFADVQRSQLERLKEVSAAFGDGDLSARVQEGADTDFNEVGHTFNIMAATLQEQQQALKNRDILEQVSQLNIILTRSLDLTGLMQNFLQRVLHLLDVQVAALYLYDAEKQMLTLFSSHGLQQEGMQTTFALGEGLVGRAAQERTRLMVSRREQTNDTFQIRTIVGTVLPSSLYHLPLTQGNELLGVLAVGSMYPMSEQTRNVLNVISSNLAATIHNTQAYEHIQQQALELAAKSRQQEESNRVLRQQRDELTVLNAALEEANRVRSQFLSTMSHELRTPLTSIIGFSQILLRPSAKSSLTERQANNIERILKNAQHLLTLINDVLDLAKIEAGRMDVDLSEVDLRELINSVVDETRSIAIEHRLQLRTEIQDGIGTIETDPRKVRQILLNLVSNGLKFTEKGSVTVSVTHPQGKEGDRDHIIIAVQDTGIGIPSEKQAYIFDAFYQVDNSNSRNYGGTGLGLSIVHELTTLLGGKVEFQSQPGQGSTFRIILPVRARDHHTIQDLRLNALETARASKHYETQERPSITLAQGEERADDGYLVVAIDDNPDVLQLIASSLEQSAYRVIGVQDSTQAVSVIQELRPNVITLDIMMPKINGWQILHQLKSHPSTASIPVILLTVLEDRSAGYVLGADEYLVKPVARDALLNVLQQVIQRTTPSSGEIEEGQELLTSPQDQEELSLSTPLKPTLLVHQESNIHVLMERLVKETGYTVQTTPEGQDIMNIIEQARPDLLMMLIKVEEKSNGGKQEDTIVEGAITSPPSSSQGQDEIVSKEQHKNHE